MQKNEDIINAMKKVDSKIKKKKSKDKKGFISETYETPLMVRRGAKQKVGRNEKCPCGSDKKYKKCCQWRENII